MSLLKSCGIASRTAGQQQVACIGPKASQRGMRVVRRFKNGDDERLRELATLKEQPITTKYPLAPADLADILPNPGELPSSGRARGQAASTSAARLLTVQFQEDGGLRQPHAASSCQDAASMRLKLAAFWRTLGLL